jgi:alpha-1,2-mannosyltransferase
MGGNNICLGQEWFRFPSHYLLPDGMRVRFVRTAPNGMLPRYFEEGGVDAAADAPSIRRWLSDRPGTFREPKTRFNANNREEMDQYAANPAIECDYFVTTFSTRADGYHQNDELRALDRLAGIHLQWKRVECRPYLNARLTPALQRAFWIPQSFLMSNGSRIFSNEKSWGEYCILKRV